MIWFVILHKSIPTCDLGFLVYSIRKGHLQKGQEEWMNTHIDLVRGMEGEEEVTLESLRKKMADFARERDWEPFHSPRNLLLALVFPAPTLLFPALFLDETLTSNTSPC